MMGKSLRDILAAEKWVDEPVAKADFEDISVEQLDWMYREYGIPTPISGDPVAR